MIRKLVRAATFAALAASTFAASAAQAAVFIYTVTGTVDAGSAGDEVGLFAGDVAGAAFEATFVVDDSYPRATYSYGATGSAVTGGGFYGADSRSPLIATLTINGVGYDVRSGNSRIDPVTDPGSGDQFGEAVEEFDRGSVTKDAVAGSLTLGAGYSYTRRCCFPFVSVVNRTTDDLDLTLLGDGLDQPDLRQTGVFRLAAGSGGSFLRSDIQAASSGEGGPSTGLMLRATTLTITNSVPEPATWGMLLLGIGAIGMRSRRRGGVSRGARGLTLAA